MRADEFAIGVGFDERVLVRRDGIELDGSVYLDGKRQLIVQRRYAWQELADVRVELIGSSLGEKFIAAISLFDADSNGESSLFGFVLVTVTRRAAPADPLVVRVPLKLRWRPGQAWVDAVQARLHQALREAGAGGYPA
ncbi:hypothetical protein [Propioniciclava flava]